MGDALKSFHGKDEVRWSFFPEVQKVLLRKWGVESFLDFNYIELLKKHFLCGGKSAHSDANHFFLRRMAVEIFLSPVRSAGMFRICPWK